MKYSMKSIILLLSLSMVMGVSAGLEQEYVQASKLVGQGDLDGAEKILLKIADQLPEAYRKLSFIETQRKNEAKAREYTLKGIAKGVANCYIDEGWRYQAEENYAEARKYYEEALKQPLVDRATVLHLLARLLVEGLGGEKDLQLGLDYYQQAANLGNPRSAYNLALHFYPGTGNSTLEDRKKAHALYLKVLEFGQQKKSLYGNACNNLGEMYLRGSLNSEKKPDIKKALFYFKQAEQAGDVQGKVNIACLTWTNKIPGDKEQAKKVFEEYAKQENDFAAMLYSAILISQGDVKEGIDLLDEMAKRKMGLSPYSVLQIAIAQLYGVGGLEKDETVAHQNLQLLLDVKDTTRRSTFLAKGYIYVMGLGVPKDIQKGLKLIEESEDKFDDIYLDTYEIFPDLKRIKEELRQKAIAELLQEDEAQKSKEASKKGKKKEAAQKDKNKVAPTESMGESSSSASARGATENIVEKKTIFDITPEMWNATWEVTDHSQVSSVDRNRKEIHIKYAALIDKSKKEELIVKVHDNPYHTFKDLKFLNKDPRIALKQASGDAETIRHHTFAQMLDYVIQCAGELVPWFKDRSQDVKDMLVADVIRLDPDTGLQEWCRAEYTFYVKHGKEYLYHRLLRPIRQHAVVS